MTLARRVGVLLALLLGTACAPAPPPPRTPEVSQAEWTLSLARLDRLRARTVRSPWSERVRVTASDPRTRRRLEARGALAVSPGHAARMILLGPGGTTAMDLWVTRDRFRVAVPALDRVIRGASASADTRSLPIGMLRWWFVAPLEGRTLYARSTPSESAWVMRDRGATVTLRTDGQRFLAVRREAGHVEMIEWLGRGLEPRAGARGRYVDATSGLEVSVVVEEVMEDAPDADAFEDPDAVVVR